MPTVTTLSPVAVQNLLARNQGRFVNVAFIKKDGTLGRRTIQPASAPFHRVAKPTPAGKRAAKTRAANHLTLVNHRTARGGWISFDLQRVVSLRTNGTTYLVQE